jgi:hypothetical protein
MDTLFALVIVTGFVGLSTRMMALLFSASNRSIFVFGDVNSRASAIATFMWRSVRRILVQRSMGFLEI